jgi:hypothetical protein
VPGIDIPPVSTLTERSHFFLQYHLEQFWVITANLSPTFCFLDFGNILAAEGAAFFLQSITMGQMSCYHNVTAVVSVHVHGQKMMCDMSFDLGVLAL